MVVSTYRLLSVAVLALTLVALLTPGDTIHAVESWVRQWLPWLPSGDGPGVLPMDKLVHIGLFALCGWCLVRAWYRSPLGWPPLLGGLIALGLGTELAQHYIPGRGADVWDWLADTVGAALGVGVAVRTQNQPATAAVPDR